MKYKDEERTEGLLQFFYFLVVDYFAAMFTKLFEHQFKSCKEGYKKVRSTAFCNERVRKHSGPNKSL